MQNYTKLIIAGACLATSTLSCATTLDQALQDAFAHDKTFKQNMYKKDAAKQLLPLAAAAYLPQLKLEATGAKRKAETYLGVKASTKPKSYDATVSQTIFSLGSLLSIRKASQSVSAAQYNFDAQKQTLISNTCNAYFTVINDYKTVEATLANETSLQQAYKIAEQKHDVGLIAATPMLQAKAELSQTQAQVIAATAQLKVDVENLHAITGKAITTYNSVNKDFKAKQPANNLANLIQQAKTNNHLLQFQRQTTQAAKTNVSLQSANWLPTIAAVAKIGKSNTNNVLNNPSKFDSSDSIAVNISVTPFTGGANFANYQQANYQYLAANAAQDAAEINTENQTRQAYLNIQALAKKITADRESIIATEASLTATQEAFKVGGQDYLPVLNAITAVSNAQKTLQNDIYSYLSSDVALKQADGSLNEKDIKYISSELNKEFKLCDKTNKKLNLCPQEAMQTAN